jgi:hypothetical protein
MSLQSLPILNSICENEGKTIDGVTAPSKQSGENSDMLIWWRTCARKVDVLIVYGTNRYATAVGGVAEQ